MYWRCGIIVTALGLGSVRLDTIGRPVHTVYNEPNISICLNEFCSIQPRAINRHIFHAIVFGLGRVAIFNPTQACRPTIGGLWEWERGRVGEPRQTTGALLVI